MKTLTLADIQAQQSPDYKEREDAMSAMIAAGWRKGERDAVLSAFRGAALPLSPSVVLDIDEYAGALEVSPSSAAARVIRQHQQKGSTT